ncbi:hypothetical protein SpCBS45565_g04544 [Spizellomyces sp. 'palustris']|nr:hypothetical protein SpCBS45565_g04544 [Spizellomyces sp. 'palustris']
MPPSASLHHHHPPSLSPLPHHAINQYTRGCYGGSQPSMLNTATTTSPYTSPQLTKKGLIRQFFNSRPQLKAAGGQGPLSSAHDTPVTAEGLQSAQDIKGPPSSPVSTPNPPPPTTTLPILTKPPSSMPVTPQSLSRPSSPTARPARSPATPPLKQKPEPSLPNDDASPLQRLLNKYPLNAAFLAHYQVTAELGSGGFGHVLAATRIKDQKEVAVKLILKRRIPVSAWARDRELGVMPMEVYLVRRCNHPNVIAFEDFFEDERFGYLVMEMHGTQWSATDNAFIDEKDRKDVMHLAKAAEAARAQVDTIPEEIEPPEKKENEFISDAHRSGSPPSSPVAATATCRHPAISRVMCEETGGAEQVSPSPSYRARQLSNPTLPSTPTPRSLPSPPPMTRTQSVPLPPKLARKPSMDLFECIEQNAHLPERHARHVFRQIAEAVAYLHSRGIVHRDLKDENIVIDSNLHVKIIDFGSAAFEPSHKKSQLFDRFQGTLQYASPEILRGERYKGRPSDIWAMGVLLYTMLHGECPFSSSEEAMASGYKPPKMKTSAECLQLVDWMLEKTPDRRPSAEQVVQHPWMRKVLP